MTFEEIKPLFKQMNYFELQRTADYLTTMYASYGAVWTRKNELDTIEHMHPSTNPDKPFE